MAKKELNEQLKSYEGYINDIPLVIDPCKMCGHSKNKGKRKSDFLPDYDRRICERCCWFYDSMFEVGGKQ